MRLAQRTATRWTAVLDRLTQARVRCARRAQNCRSALATTIKIGQHVRVTRRGTGLGLVLVLATTACSSTSRRVLPIPSCSTEPAARSSVLVTLQMVGGPPTATPQPVAGTITADAPSGQQCTVAVDRTGHVLMRLAPGTYQLTGRSPQYDGGSATCAAEAPVVFPHGVEGSEGPPPQFADVNCQRK
jgi:hypothetical protein